MKLFDRKVTASAMTDCGHVVRARHGAEGGARRIRRVVVPLHVERVLGHDRESLRPVARQPEVASRVAAVDEFDRTAEEHRRVDPRVVHRHGRREQGRGALHPGARRAGRRRPCRDGRHAEGRAERRVQPRRPPIHVQRAAPVDVLTGVERAVGHTLRRGGVDHVLEPQFARLAVVAEIVAGVKHAIRAGAAVGRAVHAEILVAAAIGEIDDEARDVHRVGMGRQPDPQVVDVEFGVVHHAAQQRVGARAGGIIAPRALAGIVEHQRQVVGGKRGPRPPSRVPADGETR